MKEKVQLMSKGGEEVVMITDTELVRDCGMFLQSIKVDLFERLADLRISPSKRDEEKMFEALFSGER